MDLLSLRPVSQAVRRARVPCGSAIRRGQRRAFGSHRTDPLLRHHRLFRARETEASMKRPRSPGASIRTGGVLPGLDAAGHGVGTLVLIAVAARPDEGRRGPGALVVRSVAATVVPGIAVGVGDRLARLVAGGVLVVGGGR